MKAIPKLLVLLKGDQDVWHFYDGRVSVGSTVTVKCKTKGVFRTWNPARNTPGHDLSVVNEVTAEYMEQGGHTVCLDCLTWLAS
jgi:hypothetical protein